MASTWLNPAFDKRILTIGPTDTSRILKRGYIICDDPGGGAPGMKGKGVRFLYNPVAVSVSHTIDPNNLIDTGAQQAAVNRGQVGNLTNIGYVSVDLLYDRTYELWDSGKKNTVAGQYGVYADVLAFYKMTGVVRGQSVSVKAPEAATYQGFDEFPRYPVNPNGRYYLYFGDKVRWYGTLSDLEITYSHWTQNMVPSRATVSVGLTLQVDNKNNGVITKGGKTLSGGTGPGQTNTSAAPGIMGPLGNSWGG